jgi:FkbM family methyltransferase
MQTATIQRALGDWSLQALVDEVRKPNKGICVPGLAQEDAEPEPSLLQHVTTELASMTAVDVGANSGGFTRRLLDAGCEVYAVEPAPEPFQELQTRFGGQPGFHALAYAIGAIDGEAELNYAVDVTEDKRYSGNLSLFSSLTRHSMVEGMEFSGAVKVETRRLDTLVRQGLLPAEPGILKIDTEGCDLDVINGMGPMKPEIVQVEFWDQEFVFGKAGARNWLSQTVPALRTLGYPRHLVIARPAAGPVLYYANLPVSIPGSWGNAIFFRQEASFQAARRWCENVLTPAYLYR